MTPLQDPPPGRDWLVQTWSASIAQVIDSMTGVAPKITADADSVAPPADILWWEQPLSFPAGARLWAGCGKPDWSRIGGSVLGAVGIDDSDDENLKSTYQEVLNQSFSSITKSLSIRLHREVTCLRGSESAPEASVSASGSIRIVLEGQAAILFAVFNDALLQALEPDPLAAAEPPPPKEVEEVKAIQALAEPAPPRSFELLLDVELPVSVSFGRAQLSLKDALKLTTGSIVELNRSVTEPVEIIVNNCVIARGQVVVIEGNFGVRIQQVISRQERLRTLH